MAQAQYVPLQDQSGREDNGAGPANAAATELETAQRRAAVEPKWGRYIMGNVLFGLWYISLTMHAGRLLFHLEQEGSDSIDVMFIITMLLWMSQTALLVWWVSYYHYGPGRKEREARVAIRRAAGSG